MVKTRIAVFVSGGGTNLQALLDAEKSGALISGEIVLVISSARDAYALARARPGCHGEWVRCFPSIEAQSAARQKGRRGR